MIRDSYDPHRSHPSTALLVIEVAISSEALDRAKAAIYAAAKIPEYWLVLPEQKRIERFTDPRGDVYLNVISIDFASAIALVCDAQSVSLDLRCLND